MFIAAIAFVSCNVLKCVSMSNEECRVRPAIMNINNNEPLFYPCSVFVKKCSGSCNDIYDLYAKLYVLDFVKSMNIKAFNLMSRTNETRHVSLHETCACKCRLYASFRNNKQRWSNNKCTCARKELIDKDKRDDEFIWNPSVCECKYDKSCDVGECLDYVGECLDYVGECLDYANCKCRKRLID